MTDVLLYGLGILIVLAGLALSIGLHEVGHLVPAKLFGVKVKQFMVGFGKTLWSRRAGETEYGVKLVPLGGYIAMTGMYPPAQGGVQARDSSTGFFNTLVQDARDASAESVDEGEHHRAFYRLPVWKKIVIMLGGPFMNLILAFVFFAIVLVGFGVPQYTTVVSQVSQCVLPASSEQTECGSADPLAPAAAAGIAPGDKIVAIDGQPISDWQQVSEAISEAPGEELLFTVERDSQTSMVMVTPVATERWVVDDRGEIVLDDDGEPLTETSGMIGITPTLEVTQLPLSEVPVFVGENVTAVAGMILSLPQRMVDVWNAAFGTEERDINGPIGVVGVGRLAGEVVSMEEAPVAARAQFLFSLLGSLNVALFVFNLVPLLPLDGGHIVGALYEGSKRRLYTLFGKPDPGPVDTAKMVPITFGVVIVLGAMSVLLLYADIVKPISLFG